MSSYMIAGIVSAVAVVAVVVMAVIVLLAALSLLVIKLEGALSQSLDELDDLHDNLTVYTHISEIHETVSELWEALDIVDNMESYNGEPIIENLKSHIGYANDRLNEYKTLYLPK